MITCLTGIFTLESVENSIPIKPVFEEITSPQAYSVGELGERWEFPSDHLPIGASVGNVHFAMWNVLDTKALHWIESNTQGLRDSFIMTGNVPDENNLTLREWVIVNEVMEMVQHSSHPRSLLALQETSKEVYKALKQELPPRMKMFPLDVEDLGHGDLFLYDSALFDCIDYSKTYYTGKSRNTYMILTLKEKVSGLTYRFIQSHVPGGSEENSKPARVELAQAIMQAYEPANITLLMGDMNRSADFFFEDFEVAAKTAGLKAQPFTNLPIPYPTHINTHSQASWIDNLFIANPYPEIKVEVASSGSELFCDIQSPIDLLNSLKPPL